MFAKLRSLLLAAIVNNTVVSHIASSAVIYFALAIPVTIGMVLASAAHWLLHAYYFIAWTIAVFYYAREAHAREYEILHAGWGGKAYCFFVTLFPFCWRGANRWEALAPALTVFALATAAGIPVGAFLAFVQILGFWATAAAFGLPHPLPLYWS